MRALGLCLSLAISGFACSAPPPKSPASGLPSYEAEDAALLDDGLSGHLFDTAFVPGSAGDDPHFKDLVLFHEFFHGDDGTGLGASHQTGWTALAGNLVERAAITRADK